MELRGRKVLCLGLVLPVFVSHDDPILSSWVDAPVSRASRTPESGAQVARVS